MAGKAFAALAAGLVHLLLTGGAVPGAPLVPRDQPAPVVRKAAGWKVTLKQAVRLSDELAQYPVRHDVFHRCSRALAATGDLMEEWGRVRSSSSSAPAPELATRLKAGSRELAEVRRKAEDVASEFGKGLEISYEGAFSDFSPRVEELAGLLDQLAAALDPGP